MKTKGRIIFAVLTSGLTERVVTEILVVFGAADFLEFDFSYGFLYFHLFTFRVKNILLSIYSVGLHFNLLLTRGENFLTFIGRKPGERSFDWVLAGELPSLGRAS